MRIDKLGSVGLNTDVQPFMLPPQSWTKMYNIATRDGEITNVVGNKKLFDLQIPPVYHCAFRTIGGVQLVVVSDGIAVHAYTMDGAMEDITPQGTPPTPDVWTGGFVSFTNLNGVLVVNSETDGAFYWPGQGNALLPLPGWDTAWTCREMVAYRYYLVALGMHEAGENYPHKVRWSSAAAEGDIPTEWVAAASNDAGGDLVGETTGHIVGARLVRDSLFIVKEDAVYDMHYIGGEWVMQLTRLQGATTGTRLQRGFEAIGGALAIFTTTDLAAFDGQAWRSLADMRVRKAMFDGVSTEMWDFSQVFYTPNGQLLAVSFVEGGKQRLTKSLVLNLEEGTWGVRHLQNSYGFDSALVTSAEGLPTWDEMGPSTTYDIDHHPSPAWTVPGTWDDQTDGTWNKGVYRPSTPDILCYESSDDDTAWWVTLLALTSANSDGTPKYCSAERVALPIGGTENYVMVTEVWPELRGDCPVSITIGGQDVADGVVTWDGPYVVIPGQVVAITPRVTGRYVAVRIESHDYGNWALGALTFNWELAGDR
jgi:hypothetical protein